MNNNDTPQSSQEGAGKYVRSIGPLSDRENIFVLNDHNPRLEILRLMADTTPSKAQQLENIMMARKYLDSLEKHFIYSRE